MFICTTVAAQSNLACKVVALHKECSGCSMKGVKSVLEVIDTRMQTDKMTACGVVKKPGQFPWAATQKSWKFTTIMLTRYFDAVTMLPVIGKGVYYFNNEKMSFGKFAFRVEDHYFYYKT